MAVLKNIEVQIFKRDVNVSIVMFSSVTVATLDFPPEHVAKLMTAVTGWTLDDDDHSHLNNLHCHGRCDFRFGNDWEFFVEASVKYPQ